MGKKNTHLGLSGQFSVSFFMVLSATALSVVFSFRLASTPASLFWQLILSLSILIILQLRFNFIAWIQDSVSVFHKRLALVFSMLTVLRLILNALSFLTMWIEKNPTVPFELSAIRIIVILFSVLAFPFLTLAYGWVFHTVFPIIKNFIKSLNPIEAGCLIIASGIFLILIAFAFNLTTVFTHPTYNGKTILVDVVYISDSPNHLITDVFFNVGARENDLRQPLYALLSMPISIIAWSIGKILFFIPNAYALLIQSLQVTLLPVLAILLSRILKLKDWAQMLFIIMVLSTFPVLLFSITIEQYIIPTFLLIVFVMAVLQDSRSLTSYFILSTGSIITSGFLFPLLTKARKFKNWFMDLFKDFIKLVIVLILAGQFHLLYFIAAPYQKMESLVPLYRTFEDKLFQYLTFVASCFVFPASHLDTTTYSYPSYQQTVITSPSILGILILCAALIGFIVSRKEKIAKISLAWILISYLILGLVGWGTLENGLVLYILYFSWPFFVLIAKAYLWGLRWWPKTRIVLACGVIAGLLFVNFNGLWDLIRFGIEHYPVG